MINHACTRTMEEYISCILKKWSTTIGATFETPRF